MEVSSIAFALPDISTITKLSEQTILSTLEDLGLEYKWEDQEQCIYVLFEFAFVAALSNFKDARTKQLTVYEAWRTSAEIRMRFDLDRLCEWAIGVQPDIDRKTASFIAQFMTDHNKVSKLPQLPRLPQLSFPG